MFFLVSAFIASMLWGGLVATMLGRAVRTARPNDVIAFLAGFAESARLLRYGLESRTPTMQVFKPRRRLPSLYDARVRVLVAPETVEIVGPKYLVKKFVKKLATIETDASSTRR